MAKFKLYYGQEMLRFFLVISSIDIVLLIRCVQEQLFTFVKCLSNLGYIIRLKTKLLSSPVVQLVVQV